MFGRQDGRALLDAKDRVDIEIALTSFDASCIALDRTVILDPVQKRASLRDWKVYLDWFREIDRQPKSETRR